MNERKLTFTRINGSFERIFSTTKLPGRFAIYRSWRRMIAIFEYAMWANWRLSCRLECICCALLTIQARYSVYDLTSSPANQRFFFFKRLFTRSPDVQTLFFGLSCLFVITMCVGFCCVCSISLFLYSFDGVFIDEYLVDFHVSTVCFFFLLFILSAVFVFFWENLHLHSVLYMFVLALHSFNLHVIESC